LKFTFSWTDHFESADRIERATHESTTLLLSFAQDIQFVYSIFNSWENIRSQF
jgi:hypothetical protein